MKRDLMMRTNLHPNENLDLMAYVDASPHPLLHPHDTELLVRKVSSHFHDAEITREVRRRHADRMYASTAQLSAEARALAHRHQAESQRQIELRRQYLQTHQSDVTLRRWKLPASAETADTQNQQE